MQCISVIIILRDHQLSFDIITITKILSINIFSFLYQDFLPQGSCDMVLASSLTAYHRGHEYKMVSKSHIFLKMTTKKLSIKGHLLPLITAKMFKNFRF